MCLVNFEILFFCIDACIFDDGNGNYQFKTLDNYNKFIIFQNVFRTFKTCTKYIRQSTPN